MFLVSSATAEASRCRDRQRSSRCIRPLLCSQMPLPQEEEAEERKRKRNETGGCKDRQTEESSAFGDNEGPPKGADEKM